MRAASDLETEGFSVRGRTSARKLAILGYHKVGESLLPWWSWQYVPEEIFAGHLSYLRKAGCQGIDLLAFLRGIEVPESLPECAVRLTFDDGYRSMRTVALPLLLEFGYLAILFVPTDSIGGLNDSGALNQPEEAICGWDDLRELERLNVSIQYHGSSLDLAGQEDELTPSKAALETVLEKPVEVFAYPYGDGGMEPEATGIILERARLLWRWGRILTFRRRWNEDALP